MNYSNLLSVWVILIGALLTGYTERFFLFQTLPSLLLRALLQLLVQGGVRPHRAVHRLHSHLRPHVLASGEKDATISTYYYALQRP